MSDNYFFINNNNKNVSTNISITIPEVNNDNINIYIYNDECKKIVSSLINILFGLDIIKDKKNIYQIIFIYLSFQHNINDILNKIYIENFINNHISFLENKLVFNLYKGEIFSFYTGYSFINKNQLIFINKKIKEISIINSLLESSNVLSKLYINFICNENISITNSTIICDI